MIVIREQSKTKIEYPLHKLGDLDKLIYFDIETTGFSRKYCIVYMIGCMYFIDGVPMYTQWLAENDNEEANVLMAFHKFLQGFSTIIHFNGTSFDMPFLKERGEKFRLDFEFNRFNSIDLYKSVSSFGHILKLENMKQKTFERLFDIKRKDPFSGGDLIEVYRDLVRTRDERLIFPLLLHNKEDVEYMGTLTSLLTFSDFFDGKYNIINFKICDYFNMNGDNCKELRIEIALPHPIPFEISYNIDCVYLKVSKDKGYITVQVKNGCYKFFFPNYKDYYYLPEEDTAIHKSVAAFVDNNYRKQATVSTCYTKLASEFIPIYCSFSDGFPEIFKESPKDKTGFIQPGKLKNDNIYDYVNLILNFLKQKK